MSHKSYSWIFIPILFLIHLTFEGLVIYNTAHHLPEFSQVGFPTNFEQAQVFAKTFKNYLHSHYYELMLFEFSSFLFLQTWCIPGTFVFNLLGGALFGLTVGFPLCVLCNVLGAVNCYLISKYFLKDTVDNFSKSVTNYSNNENKSSSSKMGAKFSGMISNLKTKLQEHKKDLFFYLVFLRVFPGSPNWLMNLSFPHLNVPIHYFAASIALGLIPWNFFTCQAGSVISTFKSKDEIMNTSTIISFIGLAAIFLIPPIYRKIANRTAVTVQAKKVE